MAPQPKRIPGETNPRPDADAPMRVVRESELGNDKGDYGLGGRTITRAAFAVYDRLRNRRRRPRQPQLLAGRRSPDPRLEQPTIDPNARFLGEQMGGVSEGGV